MQRLAPTRGFETSFAQIAEAAFGRYGTMATATLASVIIFANLSGAIWAVSRLVFSLSREGLLPRRLQRTRNGTPWLAVGATTAVLVAVTMLGRAGLLPLDRMLALAGQNFVVLYAVAALVLLGRGNSIGQRLLGGSVALAATCLVVAQGSLALYPLVLAAAGFVLATREDLRADPRRGALPAVGCRTVEPQSGKSGRPIGPAP